MFQFPTSLYRNDFSGAQMRENQVLIDCYDGDFEALAEHLMEMDILTLLESKKDSKGNSCMHVAAYRGHLELVELMVEELQEAEVDEKRVKEILNAGNYQGVTAMHLACQRNHVRMMQLLLKCGAIPNLPDVNGTTPLHYAAEAEALDVVRQFKKYGFPLDEPNYAGVTSLVIACRENKRNVAFELANGGADICRRSTLFDGVQYRTPLLIAQEGGWGEDLRRAGAVPEKPEAPYITNKTDEDLLYQWNEVQGRSAPVEYYRVQVRKIDRLNPDSPWITVADGLKERKHRFYICQAHCSSYSRDLMPEDLLPSEVYVVRVFAHSIVGWSEPSEPSKIIVTPPAAPSKPMSPKIVNFSNTSVTLRWTLPNSNGVPIDKTEVQFRMAHSPYTQWTTVPDYIFVNRVDSDDEPSSPESDTDDEEDESKRVEFSTYTVGELMPQSFYKFRIRCHNVVGWSYFSEESEKVRTHTPHDARRRGINFSSKGRQFLTGSLIHAEARFMANAKFRENERKRAAIQHEDGQKFIRHRRIETSATKIQQHLRGWYLRRKYEQYLKDFAQRQSFLVEYDIVDQFHEKWRAKLMRFTLEAMHQMACDQRRKDERRARRLERGVRRERRQLIRRQRQETA